MMTFEPLWKTMEDRGLTTYKLINEYNFSRGTLDKLKHDRNVTLETINTLCKILDCNVEDVIEYKKD